MSDRSGTEFWPQEMIKKDRNMRMSHLPPQIISFFWASEVQAMVKLDTDTPEIQFSKELFFNSPLSGTGGWGHENNL